MKNIMIFMIAALSLSGCGIYGKYHRPDVNTDNLYKDIEVSEEDTASLADLSWRELFTDPQLQTLIEEALDSNTDMNIARLKVKEARASLLNAKLMYLPSVQLDPQGSITSYNADGASYGYDLGASASWEFDIFGKTLNRLRGAKMSLAQSEAYSLAVQTQLIATMADSYYSLLLLDKQLEITTATVESWREYVRSLKALMNAGQADRSTVNQAEASCMAAEASLLEIKRQINELENAISSMLASAPRRIERGTLDGQSFPEELEVGVPVSLLSRRPDVRQAEYALAQSFYATNLARAAFYPTLTLSGSAGWTNNGVTVGNPAAWLLQAVGSLVEPLFNRGTNIANLRIAKAQQEEALLSFRQSLLDAGGEVNNALMLWQTARAKIEFDTKQVEFLTTTVEDAKALMEYGTANYLQVLTAQQSLLQAELSLASDRYSEIQGVINLYHALGGGADAQ